MTTMLDAAVVADAFAQAEFELLQREFAATWAQLDEWAAWLKVDRDYTDPRSRCGSAERLWVAEYPDELEERELFCEQVAEAMERRVCALPLAGVLRLFWVRYPGSSPRRVARLTAGDAGQLVARLGMALRGVA